MILNGWPKEYTLKRGKSILSRESTKLGEVQCSYRPCRAQDRRTIKWKTAFLLPQKSHDNDPLHPAPWPSAHLAVSDWSAVAPFSVGRSSPLESQPEIFPQRAPRSKCQWWQLLRSGQRRLHRLLLQAGNRGQPGPVVVPKALAKSNTLWKSLEYLIKLDSIT